MSFYLPDIKNRHISDNFLHLFFSVSKTVERFERRILEEFTKMFTDSRSFYFSLTGDITNALQRQLARVPVTTTNSSTGEEIG